MSTSLHFYLLYAILLHVDHVNCIIYVDIYVNGINIQYIRLIIKTLQSAISLVIK
jgi:hypothetical protein